jgi:hypothetical protein
MRQGFWAEVFLVLCPPAKINQENKVWVADKGSDRVIKFKEFFETPVGGGQQPSPRLSLSAGSTPRTVTSVYNFRSQFESDLDDRWVLISAALLDRC